MGTPYIGEIRMFGGNFAPVGWALCDGQLLPISENDALFVLIGTTYGGDGQETFALPDLRGRVPAHQGNGQILGEMAGTETVTLTVNQIPAHSHPLVASGASASSRQPIGNTLAASTGQVYTRILDRERQLNPAAVTRVGGSQPHDNTQPFLCINFIISLFGIFPSQN